MKNLERIKSVRQKLDLLQVKIMEVENMENVSAAPRGRALAKEIISEMNFIRADLNEQRRNILERRT